MNWFAHSIYILTIISHISILQDDPDKFKYTTQLLIAMIQLFLCNWAANVLLTEVC